MHCRRPEGLIKGLKVRCLLSERAEIERLERHVGVAALAAQREQHRVSERDEDVDEERRERTR